MPPFPNFQNATTFPSFTTCPVSDGPATPEPPTYFLIATIQEDLTFTDTPTFICKDREDATFALKVHVIKEVNFDAKALKKGYAIVIPGARRSGMKDGKQGFVEVRPEDFQVCGIPGKNTERNPSKDYEFEADGKGKIIPTNVGNLIFMSGNPLIVATSKEGESDIAFCDGCGDEKEKKRLFTCKGCESAWYCEKKCQKKGWTDGGHKGDCKILGAVGRMELGDRGWSK